MSERERCVVFAAKRPPPGDDRVNRIGCQGRTQPLRINQCGRKPNRAQANPLHPSPMRGKQRRIFRGRAINPADIQRRAQITAAERQINRRKKSQYPGDPNGKVLNQKTNQDRVADCPDRRLQPSGKPIPRGQRQRNQCHRPTASRSVAFPEHWPALAFNSPGIGTA